MRVFLLSGGLDSTVIATKYKQSGSVGLIFRYGQKAKKEITMAQKIAEKLNMKHKVINLTGFKDIAFSSLTGKKTSAFYVPLRNTFFIVVAAAYLESEILRRLSQGERMLNAEIFVGATLEDVSPDTKPSYFRKMERAVNAGSEAYTKYMIPIAIRTPFIGKPKKDIIREGIILKAPLAWTWSCYTDKFYPCGKCHGCIPRAKAFKRLRIKDPLIERLDSYQYLWSAMWRMGGGIG